MDERDPAYTATYAKYAKVGIVEDMTSIDTLLNGFMNSANPDKNWVGTGSGTSGINGWAKWHYASYVTAIANAVDSNTPATGNRSWILIGNEKIISIYCQR